MSTLCQCVSDDVIQCFMQHCLTDLFHCSVDDDASQLCEAMLYGLSQLVQSPSLSVCSLASSVLTTVYQRLPTPYYLCVRMTPLLRINLC